MPKIYAFKNPWGDLMDGMEKALNLTFDLSDTLFIVPSVKALLTHLDNPKIVQQL